MFCPFMSYQDDYGRIYCDPDCAIWDEKNECCSFKRITNKSPEIIPFPDYSKTDTPIYNPVITATPDPPGYTHPQVWYEAEV